MLLIALTKAVFGYRPLINDISNTCICLLFYINKAVAKKVCFCTQKHDNARKRANKKKNSRALNAYTTCTPLSYGVVFKLWLTLITHGPLDNGENSKTPPGSSFSKIIISRLVKPAFRIWFSTLLLGYAHGNAHMSTTHSIGSHERVIRTKHNRKDAKVCVLWNSLFNEEMWSCSKPDGVSFVLMMSHFCYVVCLCSISNNNNNGSVAQLKRLKAFLALCDAHSLLTLYAEVLLFSPLLITMSINCLLASLLLTRGVSICVCAGKIEPKQA